jgi:hypothetical protein
MRRGAAEGMHPGVAETRPAGAEAGLRRVVATPVEEVGSRRAAATPVAKKYPRDHLVVEQAAEFRRFRRTQSWADLTRRSVGI